MRTIIPVIGLTRFSAFILQVLLIFIFSYVFYRFNVPYALVFGILTLYVIQYILRQSISKYHRKGIKLVLKEEFEKAIPYFEKSVLFFEKRKWIDRYRLFILLSSSQISYLEMGLYNIGFCYSQIGRGAEAKLYFKKTLSLFPQSSIALNGLKMIGA